VDVTPLVPAGRQIVESYGPGRFRVSGVLYTGSILVLPQRTLAWGLIEATAATLDSLEEIMAAGRTGSVDVLLFGCGARAVLPPAPLRLALRQAGVVVEPMDTGAAARTYNVLAAEGRRVAAALIALS